MLPAVRQPPGLPACFERSLDEVGLMGIGRRDVRLKGHCPELGENPRSLTPLRKVASLWNWQFPPLAPLLLAIIGPKTTERFHPFANNPCVHAGFHSRRKIKQILGAVPALIHPSSIASWRPSVLAGSNSLGRFRLAAPNPAPLKGKCSFGESVLGSHTPPLPRRRQVR